MAAIKQKLGRVLCPVCLLDGKQHQIMLKVNEAKTLTWNCDECDSSGFNKANTAGQDILRSKLPAGSTALEKQPMAPGPTPAEIAAAANRAGGLQAKAPGPLPKGLNANTTNTNTNTPPPKTLPKRSGFDFLGGK